MKKSKLFSDGNFGWGCHVPTSMFIIPSNTFTIKTHGKLGYGVECPKEKLDVKGRLSLKSKLILFFKRYVAERT